MTRKKYSFTAIITAALLIVCVALCLVIGNTVENIVSGGSGQNAFAAEVSGSDGKFVENGKVAEDYDPVATAKSLGYTDDKIERVGTSTVFEEKIRAEGAADKYYYLADNIEVLSLDTGAFTFRGVLDGNGKTITIKGETDLTSTYAGGLFGYIENGTIKNVTIAADTFSVAAANNGDAYAGIITGRSSNAKIDNVRVDLNYSPADVQDGINNPNKGYLYDKYSNASTTLFLGGMYGGATGTENTISNVTVSVNAAAGKANRDDWTVAGFGVHGWRKADDKTRWYITGGFIGKIDNGAKVTMTNVTLEGNGKIYNHNESIKSEGGFMGIGEKKRVNSSFIGGFVGQIGGADGLVMMGVNDAFTGKSDQHKMNNTVKNAALVGTGVGNGTYSNIYISDQLNTSGIWIMGDADGWSTYTKYDLDAPIYLSGSNVVIPSVASKVWAEGQDALYAVNAGGEDKLVIDENIVAQQEDISYHTYTFPQVNATSLNEAGALYSFSYVTMGSADIADGFEYNAETNTYSFAKTYDGAANAKDISVSMTAGTKNKTVNVFGGEKANSGNAGEYVFTLNKDLYAAAGIEETTLTAVEGNYLVDKASGMICKMNVADGAQININIAKLAVEIAFEGEGNITYADSLDTVKANNPVSIISVGGVETNVTPDVFSGYTLNGYAEKTAAGTEITLSLSEIIMSGAEANYEFTLGNVVTTIKQYQITGALSQDKFTTTEIEGGAVITFVPSAELPDELVYTYEYSLSPDGDWTADMPTESNRYYVRITFDDPNYNLATNVYSFTITAVVTVNTTDKVVEGVFTTEYFNTVEELKNALLSAVDYDAEIKEETDHFVFSIDGVEIASALDVSDTDYNITATLKSQRYEEASTTFALRIVTRKISVSGETPNASWSQFENGVYNAQNKEFKLETEDEFDKTYTITWSATENGEYTAVEAIRNAGYYKVIAASGNANYEIVDGNGTYFVEKATPKVDFGNISVNIAYGAEAVTGDTAPAISGMYDANTYTVSTLTEGGDVYTAASVNAGGKVIITTQDFVVTENAENYNDVEVVAKEVVVDKAAVTVVTTGRNVTYGDELAYVASDFYSAVNGLVGSDAVTAEFSTDYVVKTAAGTVCEVVLTFTFSEGNADNYIINNGESVVTELTVDKRTVNGTVAANDSVYNGKEYQGAYVESEDILDGDSLDMTFEYSRDNSLFVQYAPVDAGTYFVRVKSVNNPNYAMGTIANSVEFTVSKADAPVISATGKNGLVYNGAEFNVKDTFDVAVEGLFEGDEYLADVLVVDNITGKIVNAGEYTLVLHYNYLDNYELPEAVNVTVTVNKAPVTVTLRDNSVIYGNPLGGNEIYFVGADGLIGKDAFNVTGYEYLTEYVPGQTAAGTSVEVEVEYTLDNADNYIVNNGEPLVAYLDVEKRVLEGALSAANKTYDGKAYSGVTAVWDNLVGEDGVEVSYEYSSDGRNYSGVAPKDAGTYYVRAAGVTANGNYEVNPLETATFTVSKAQAPVINAKGKTVEYSGQIINPVNTVEYTVSGLFDGDEALADNVNIYSGETILGVGTYRVGLVLKGLENYEDAEAVVVEITVGRADREVQATARMGYGYVEVTVDERNTVEYSFDNATWTALPEDGRIAVDVTNVVTLYLRYIQTDNYNQSAVKAVDANITYDVLEEYVGRHYLNAEVSFANAKEIATVLGWQDDAVGEKSGTYSDVVGTLEAKYDGLMNSAKETVVAALEAGANMSGYQKLAATVISVSVGGLSLALGAMAIGSIAIKKRKGGYRDEK